MTDSSSPARILGRASLAFALFSASTFPAWAAATVEGSTVSSTVLATGISETQDDAESEAELAKKIDTFLGHARRGSAVIRPQAANRLVRLGEPAAKRILELAGGSNEQLALLGSSLIEIFGAFEDSPSGDKLRQRLWPVIEDSEFPWRPAAARGLAMRPVASEKERFVRYLDDPIAPVRLSSLDALFKLTEEVEGPEQAKSAEEAKAAEAAKRAVRKNYLQHAVARLSDESDFVRREAALQLHARGHGYALLWLLEDMKRRDVFFGAPFGKMARYEAMRGLMSRKIDLGDYNPELPPDTNLNREGLAALEKRIRDSAAKSERQLPADERGLLADGPGPIARAADPVTGAVIGLQLKSCRRGDFYLRWTEDDVLVVGYGNPVRIQLATGTTAALVEAGKTAQAPLDDQVFWGRAGCDMEGYYMPRADTTLASPLNLIIAKNEEPIQGLRPAALSTYGAELAASIPSDEDLSQSDPRTRELARRVRSAFASIGGPVAELAVR